ncbi:MAG TPA: NAD(P)-dependent oxidoreductase, partial [Caldithrix sp.]|nr:NAD(P)-dependent oxidoreductase [Caldithrix sp.]
MNNMDFNLPGIVVTGASGFIGSNFLELACEKYRLFCLARRSRIEAKIPDHRNIRWTQVDIADWEHLQEVARCIKDHNGADYMLHLAGYYDFTYKDNPEYQRTNVEGTKNVLELARLLDIKQFIFSSSLVRCKFPKPGEALSEETNTCADFPYAESKCRAEEIIESYSKYFSCSIMRLAAVYSDWCEYPPVYAFLENWTSSQLISRIVGGKGNSAVPYIHINDLVKMIFKIIEKSKDLPEYCILNASPCKTVTHNQLFNAAVRYYYGRDIKPIHIPKWLAVIAVAIRQWLLGILGKPPFERLWMMGYIDRDMAVDANKTYERLDWKPTNRYNLDRRLLILIENMKSYPETWHLRNEEAFKHIDVRPNLLIAHVLLKIRDPILEKITDFVCTEENAERFCHYNKMKKETLHWFLNLKYQVLVTCIQTRDRKAMRNYAQLLGYSRYKQGFRLKQICDFITVFGEFICEELNRQPELKKYKQEIYDYVTLNLQLAEDEVEEIYEQLDFHEKDDTIKKEYADLFTNEKKIEHIVHQLEDTCKGDWDF